MPLQLRLATPDDHARCLEILHSADEDDNRTRATMADPAHSTYVAMDGPTMIGAAIMHWQATDAEIAYIAVTETMRGRGFGKQMIEALITQARLRGMQAVLVGTANASLGNIAFYQKCGFRMDHVRHNFFDYFTQPVLENGIPIRDMIVFRLLLD
ncbi:MAG: GNAT family N-acetyltransferase [Anaerolineae bacterium]|nr:GNAT family N-acetyltransferase [Anaerolineae bacterium]